jgi:hypothetical protein
MERPPSHCVQSYTGIKLDDSSRFMSFIVPTITKLTYDIRHIEQLPKERIETLRGAGIKVRDFAYEPNQPMRNSSKAPSFRPCVLFGHHRLAHVQSGQEPRSTGSQGSLLFHHVQPVRLHRVRLLYQQTGQAAIVTSRNESIPTPPQCVWLRCQAGLATYPEDYPGKEFSDIFSFSDKLRGPS